MEISCLFRKPKFPILCSLDGYVVAANSMSEFGNIVASIEFKKDDVFPIIDLHGEGWSFYPEYNAISPLTFKKRWFKKEVIDLFNNRTNNKDNILYSEKSISNKRFDRLFRDIVNLNP